MNKIEKVAVVMGGPSKEREVSFRTGHAVMDALKTKGYDVTEIDLDPKNFAKQLKECGATVVFNAVHGLYGEDGRMQGCLEMLKIPYTGPGLLASALGMNKFYTKRIFEAMHVPTAKCLYITKNVKKTNEACAEEIIDQLGLPVVVKPASQGSSIGVTIVKEAKDLAKALADAFVYDTDILVEAFFTGKEVAGAILETEKGFVPMPLVLIEPKSGVYDYDSKYTEGATVETCPAPFDEETTKKLQSYALAAYKALGCRGVARADLMLADNGDAIVLEVNTVPGMTATSLVPKMATPMGLTFPDLCEIMLKTARY
ncbi:MAG: D-alanine--D-alanine ligase [Acidaminococcaceae bacterium]|jgi:D-alanine-D-alanine ligase|nr:D-alanine--D-alanine ligase [Acidaminococcaceae bacterium]